MKLFGRLLAIVALLCSTAAQARKDDRAEVRKVGQEFAQCVVKKRSELAREFIRTYMPGDDLPSRATRLMDGDCLVRALDGDGGDMSFPVSTFHNTLAEELMRLDHPVFVSLPMVELPALRHADIKDANSFTTKHKGKRAQRDRDAFDDGRFDAVMSRIGECVVRTDQAKAFALLQTEITTADEMAKLKTLSPVIGGCLPEGTTIRLDAGYIRGVVARSYWRLADMSADASRAAHY